MDIQLSDEVSQAYLSEVEDILKNKEFLSLSLYEHHQWTNRLMHSINVSYISWKLAKKLGCDATVAARAGLLHDIGKSIDHDVEGSHIQIGVDLCRKYKESAVR